MNAYAERFVQSIKQECLDHFVVFGTQHLDHLCKEYLEYYHAERPHQGLENELLVKPPAPKSKKRKAKPLPAVVPLSSIRCQTRWAAEALQPQGGVAVGCHFEVRCLASSALSCARVAILRRKVIPTQPALSGCSLARNPLASPILYLATPRDFVFCTGRACARASPARALRPPRGAKVVTPSTNPSA